LKSAKCVRGRAGSEELVLFSGIGTQEEKLGLPIFNTLPPMHYQAL